MQIVAINLFLPLFFALILLFFFAVVASIGGLLYWIGVFDNATAGHLLIVARDAVLSFVGIGVVLALAGLLLGVFSIIKYLLFGE